MKILLLGSNGQVGWELLRSLAPLGEVVGLTRSQADFARPAELSSTIRAAKPAIIVNAAAYTQVDKAESDEPLANLINGESVAVLAEQARQLNAILVHYSTDYVFNGAKGRAYLEEDPTSPLNAYGRSKLLGEEAIVASQCRHLILRTSWIYAARGHNFLRTILRLSEDREHLRVVDDQWGAPTPARLVAAATAGIVAQLRHLEGETFDRSESGIYHLTAAGSTTWCRFAEAIVAHARQSSLAPRLRVAQIEAIDSSQYPQAAVRPRYSELCCDKVLRHFSVALPSWQDALSMIFAELDQVAC